MNDHPAQNIQPPPPGPRKQKSGRHGLMMVACCIPMLAIAIVLVATGAVGVGFIFIAVLCTAMMALMMRGMNHGGMNHGGMNHDGRNRRFVHELSMTNDPSSDLMSLPADLPALR